MLARRYLPEAVVALAVAAFVIVRAQVTQGLGGFPVANALHVGAGHPAELRVYGGGGYDGQFVYRLTLDPFTRAVTAHGITLDLPAYRQQRIATALLAHLLTFVPGVGAALALVLVNAIAVVVAFAAARLLLADYGVPLWKCAVVAVPACLAISLARDLTEPVAWAGVLVGLHLARRGRWSAAAAALSVAVLARETSLVVVGGLGLAWLISMARTRRIEFTRAWLLVPACVGLGWQVWVAHNWHGRLPILSGPANNSSASPFGVFGSLLRGWDTSSVTKFGLGVSYVIERATILGLIICAALVLARREKPIVPGVGWAWFAAVLVAVTVKSWTDDVQFLRATYEAWGLSAVLLATSRTRVSTVMLGCAGLVTVGVTLLYAIRV